MSLAGDVRVLPCRNVTTRLLDDGAVLVNLGSGACFELNRMGSEIWQLIAKGTTRQAICDVLLERYAVDRNALAGDVATLCEALLREGLIEPTGQPAGPDR